MRNSIFLIGRLVRDVEYRTSESGKGFARFTIAVQRSYKNEDGIYETDFINCATYSFVADNLHKYTKKGDLIGIQGRLQNRTYESEGVTKYITEVIAERATILQPKAKEETPEEPGLEEANEIVITDDDLPF